MVKICFEDDVSSCFVNYGGVGIIENDFAAFLDKSTAAQQWMWHMVKNSNTCGCCWEVIEWDCSGFNLMHAVAIGDTNMDAVCDGLSVPNAGLFTCVVITCSRVQFPGGHKIAGVVG